MQSSNQEGTVIRTYLDTCLDLPWNSFTEDDLDIAKAQRILDRDHYGLKKVKDRILEVLAVRKLAPDVKGRSSVWSALRVSVRPALPAPLPRA